MTPESCHIFTARDGAEFHFFRTSQPSVSPEEVSDRDNDLIQKREVYSVRNARYGNEYNCHGLTFISKLGWFQDVRRLLSAHDYRLIAEVINKDIDDLHVYEKISKGDVVVYLDNMTVQHTGIVWAVKKYREKYHLTILSKWGSWSEYFHHYKKVPEIYGKTIQIWTDRE